MPKGTPLRVRVFSGEGSDRSARLFKRLETVGKVKLWPAKTGRDLREALLDAIFPKVRLTDQRGELPQLAELPGSFPRAGWPSRPASRRDPPYDSDQIHW